MEVFRPYVSLFRDPGMDEATKDLVEKYYKNMEYWDALSLKLNELQNAPFSGDALINKNLKYTINTGLEGLANEGAYEHYEKELRKLGTTFNTLAPAISQNYAAYTKANQDLKERLEKKEINDEQYQLAKIYNTYGYEGLKLDPTGRVDQSTYFSPKTIYNDAKPIELLSARIKDLLPRTYNKETTRIGQDADGKWTATDGEKTMQFNDDDVTAIVNSVKRDAQGYISQLSDMRAVNALAADKVVDFITEEIASSKQRLIELEAGKKSAKKDQIAQYDDAIKKVGEAMTKYQEVLNSGDKNKMAQTVREISIQEEYAKIDDYGDTQRGLQTYETVTKRDNDMWRAKAIYEAMLNMPTTTSSIGEVTAATDGTGKNFAEKSNNLAAAKAKSEEYAKLAADLNISDELRANYQKMQRAQDILVQRIETSLKEATDASISMVELEKVDPKIIGVFKTMMPGATAGDIYRQLQRTFDNPNDQDYKDFEAAFNIANGDGAFAKYLDKEYPIKRADPQVAKFSGYSQSPGGALDVINHFYNSFDSKINNAFKEIKTSPQFTNRIIMPTQEQTIQATNGVNEFFQTMQGQSGRPLKDSEQIIVDGEVKYGKDKDILGFNVVKWEYSADADMFQLILKGTGDNADKTKTVYMKGEQVIQGEGKDKALNAPVQRFATEVNSTGFGLREGQSRMVKGLWSFPYLRDSPESLPVDYKVTMRGGVEIITFYPSGSDKPIGLSRQGQTDYTLDDSVLQQMFMTNEFVPTPRKK